MNQNGQHNTDGMPPMAPEDGGYAVFNPAQLAGLFLAPAQSFDGIMVNARLDTVEGHAMLTQLSLAKKYQSTHILEWTASEGQRSIGGKGEARKEAVAAGTGTAPAGLLASNGRRPLSRAWPFRRKAHQPRAEEVV